MKLLNSIYQTIIETIYLIEWILTDFDFAQ